MAELWRRSEHEALTAAEWDASRAEEAIRTMVADAEAAFDGERWPFHPADEVDDSPNSIYLGVAGMAWALHELGSSGWGDAVLGALDRYRLAEARYLGVAHGLAGNARALANRRTVDVDSVLARHALRDGPLANWPPREPSRPDEIRVQWCHGAPGIVAALGDVMDEELALAGGELTWRAGPLAKGSNLCHGTAGNAYAFLALHRRTGDELWLDRARAFAMHAIGQVERERAGLGRGRYSLFTGDIGVALFLRHLLDGEDRFPTMGPFRAQ